MEIYDPQRATRLCVLNENYNVHYEHEINGTYYLYFSLPAIDAKVADIKRLNTVYCGHNNQWYRISEINKSNNGVPIVSITCMSLYHADEALHFIRDISDTPQTLAYDIFALIFDYTDSPFRVMTTSELSEKGLTPLTRLIDFPKASKTTPDEVVKSIINCAGYGELYIDNYNIALVEQLGSPSVVTWVTLHNNAQSLSQKESATSIVTRLIPYGSSDITISSVNGGKDYIDSPNIDLYGVREKSITWSNFEDSVTLKSRAEWAFSPSNPERIDVPHYTIEGSIVGLFEQGLTTAINLGDAVRVIDEQTDTDQTERVIKVDVYPYEYTNSLLTIGHTPKELFDYVRKISKSVEELEDFVNNYSSDSGNEEGGDGGDEGDNKTTIENAVIIDHVTATNHIIEVQIDREIEYYVGNFATVPDKKILQYEFGVSPLVFYAQGNGLTFQAGDSYDLFGLTYILQEYNQIEMENGDKIDLKMEFVSLTTSSTTFMITSTRNGGVVGTYSRGIASSPEDPIVNFGMSLGQNIGGGYDVSGINSALAGASGVPVIILGSVAGSTSVTYPILPITIYTISQSGTVGKVAPRCGQWISPAANTNIKMTADEYINALQIQSITVTSGWQTTATFS